MTPEASRGRSLRSSVIGTRVSPFEPRRRLHSSSPARFDMEAPAQMEVVSRKKRGRSRVSRRIDAEGSVGVTVRERKRGLSRTRAVVRPGRRME